MPKASTEEMVMRFFILIAMLMVVKTQQAFAVIQYFKGKPDVDRNVILWMHEIDEFPKLDLIRIDLDKRKRTLMYFSSGGGSVTGGELLITQILKLAIFVYKQSKRPLEIYFADKCASMCIHVLAALTNQSNQNNKTFRLFVYEDTVLGFHGIVATFESGYRCYTWFGTRKYLDKLVNTYNVNATWLKEHEDYFEVNRYDFERTVDLQVTNPLLKGSGFFNPSAIISGNGFDFRNEYVPWRKRSKMYQVKILIE